MGTVFNRPSSLKAAGLLVPLFLFLASDYFYGYLNQSFQQQTRFTFSLPLQQDFADDHGISTNPDIEKIIVTGFFSDWSQDNENYALKPKGEGNWELEVQFAPGNIQYKYVLFVRGDPSGKWLLDPANPKTTSDSHGGMNSLMERPDYMFYQLITDIVTLGIFIFLACLFTLQKIMAWLMHQKLSLANTFIVGTLLVVLFSNVSLGFYQVYESRKLVQQGILDSVNLTHNYLTSQNGPMANLRLHQDVLKEQLKTLFWQAKTRVENNQSSIMQITLSDIALYGPDLDLIHVQNRQQNYELQITRSKRIGAGSLQNYFHQGVFGPLIEKATRTPDWEGYFVAHPSADVIAIETPETRFARSLLGFSNMLIPIQQDGRKLGYYAVAIQVKMFGSSIFKIVMINSVLILITLIFAYLLLRTVGKMASFNLHRLTQWAQKINQGDLTSHVDIRTQDEIQDLAENFAEMQSSLKASFEKIEQQNVQLNRAAYFDLETALPNRKKLLLDHGERQDCTLVLIELTGYEQLQRFLGDKLCHQVVLSVLNQIQSRVKELNGHELYRIAPEQFCLVSHQKEAFLSETLANDVIQTITNEAQSLDNIALNIEASGGICGYAHRGESFNQQLERAGLALSQAKSEGVTYCVYSPALDKRDIQQHNVEMIKRVRTAIQRNRVLPFFQPIVVTNTKEVITFECLARIKESDNLILPPGAFLNTAKHAGLYPSISHIMFEKSIQSLAGRDHRISLNLSAKDIDNQSSRDYIQRLIEAHQSVADRITLEITETEQIANYEVMKGFIEKVKAFGVKIALDDFGAGFSNFTHLLSLNIDFIKIDGSLIKNLDTDTNALKITRAIVECARSLNIQIVAEFVHNEAIYQIVKELGIDYCQGYLFGAPSEYLP